MFLIILSTITASLSLATPIRGFIAFRQHQRDAVTIEEGLGVIRWRLLSREHLQPVLVVLISGLVSGMAAMAFYWGGRLAWVSEMIYFAYIAIACVFLVVPWLRRMSMDQVVRYLEKQSVPNIDAQNRQGNLKQLMRTYHYYHKTTTQPALFDWIRRQLRLHMLGKDPPERDGGMGVMTDQDNTQKGSEGDYDDFVLERREDPRHARVIEFSRCGQ